jgi:hypothetical protein
VRVYVRLDPDTEAKVLAAAEPSKRPPWREVPVPTPAVRPAPATRGRTFALEVTLPLRLPNPLNARGAARQRIARPKRQREAVLASLAWFMLTPAFMGGPWRVELTRLGGKVLDDDALEASLKAVRDAVAVWLVGGTPGLRDNDQRITWDYFEAPRGRPAGVKIRIEVGV